MKAIIFDLDDTLIASAALWQKAEEEFLHSHQKTWSPDLARQYKGMNGPDVAKFLHHHLHLEGSLDRNQRAFRTCLAKSFARGPICPMAGALSLIDHLATEHCTMAVASGSPLPLIELALEGMQRAHRFSVILSSESVSQGKPFPDVFLKTAEAMQRDPGDCLVIEDSLIGVQAAKAAGMKVVVVPSRADPAFRLQADECLSSLADWATSQLLTDLR